MVVITFFLTIILFLLFIFFMIYEAQSKVKKRIDTFVSGEGTISATDEKIQVKLRLGERISKFKEKYFDFVKEKIEDYLNKKLSVQKEETIEKKLLQAGQPWGMTMVDYHVFGIVLKIVLPLVFFAYGKLFGLSMGGSIFFTMVGFVLSIFLPNIILNQKIKKRYKQALKELPDFLDILTVCLEAGLGFDMALNKVVSKKEGILASEFHVCLEEIRLGKTRREGMVGVRDRLDFKEFKSLINSILQAEKLGMSVVSIFRVKSQEEREKRRQRAEEEAMKAPIKILFPLIIFIFPSIFIVLLGPVLIQLMTAF